MARTQAQKRAYNQAYYAANREKLVIYQRDWYEANKDQQAAKNREARYGLTVAQHDELLSKQHGLCAICKTATPAGKGTWHVDHCHASGNVRGLLCHHCNVGLGHFKDTPETLRQAAEYLEKQ